MWTSILGMNPNCLYAETGDWTQVAVVQGEAANHYTNDVLMVIMVSLSLSFVLFNDNWSQEGHSVVIYDCILFYACSTGEGWVGVTLFIESKVM